MKDILDIKNLFMIVAMESEEKAFLEKREFTTQTIGVKTQFVLKSLSLPQCTLTLARSGVGLSNAALLLAFAAEKIEIDAVVLLGVGGALDEKLDVGDAVIAKQVLQHDSISTFENERVFIAPGELTLSATEDQQVNPFMKCDPVLVQWMKKSIEKTAVGKTYCGTILSGSEFVASNQRKKELRSLHPEALMVDMEAAALAQVSRKLEIPFVAAKTVVDRAKPSTSIAEDYLTFLNAATLHSSAVLKEILNTFET